MYLGHDMSSWRALEKPKPRKRSKNTMAKKAAKKKPAKKVAKKKKK